MIQLTLIVKTFIIIIIIIINQLVTHYNRYSFMKKYVVVSPHIYSIEYVLFLYEFSRVLLLHVLQK